MHLGLLREHLAAAIEADRARSVRRPRRAGAAGRRPLLRGLRAARPAPDRRTPTRPDERPLPVPLWTIHAPTGTYAADDRRALSVRITELYTGGPALPASSVTVLFHDLDPDAFLVGGEPRADTVRITVDHVARRFDDAVARLGTDIDLRRAWLDRVAEAVRPFTTARGLHWELHADETPRALWTIDGHVPPDPWSEEERRWARDGVPS